MKHMIHGMAVVIVVALMASGCTRDTEGLAPARGDDEPLVFTDTYAPGVTFHAFLNSKLDAVQIDATEAARGNASLRVTVPDPSTTPPWFAGGAFANEWARDLTGYNCLTFWARAEKNVSLDIVGLGNDNTDTSRYPAGVGGVPLTTTWQKYIVPIPLPEKLPDEDGLFFFAEGYEDSMGYDFWLDDIQFEKISGISNPRPSLYTTTVTTFTGATVRIDSAQTIFDVLGADVTVGHAPEYFTYSSSEPSVARSTGETVKVVGPGTAEITATLGAIDVAGAVTVNALAAPSVPAPRPTHSPDSVISIYSERYGDWPLYRWSPHDWDEADVTDFQIAGDEVKAYVAHANAGIDFFFAIEFVEPDIPLDRPRIGELVDASEMNYFHVDIWIPDALYVKIKLVDYGPDGVYQGAPDSEKDLPFHAGSNPVFTSGVWSSLDIPMEVFKIDPGIVGGEHLAQLIITTDGKVAFVDNIYFHK